MKDLRHVMRACDRKCVVVGDSRRSPEKFIFSDEISTCRSSIEIINRTFSFAFVVWDNFLE
jgi:hypothetical protein